MTLTEYNKSKELQEAAKAYTEKHGGSFFWEEPGGGFVYELEDDAFSPPEAATAKQVLTDLKSGKPLQDIWRKLEDEDPEVLY